MFIKAVLSLVVLFPYYSQIVFKPTIYKPIVVKAIKEDIFKEIEQLDIQLSNTLRKTKTLFFFRVGSSLHKDNFKEESDIDYIAIVESLNIDFVNKFPDRTSPSLNLKTKANNLDFFFWRVDIKPLRTHKVNVIFYTADKFLSYLEQRSGAKIYLLNEHLLLIGDKRLIEKYKRLYPANKETAINDLNVLKDKKYNAGTLKFLWSWRSVALVKSNYKTWLKNKNEIEEYVTLNYNGKLKDKAFLIQELETLLRVELPLVAVTS